MFKKLPIVSIIGRQNVGKSTLFNTLIKEKKAIVDTIPGLTRDILSYSINYKSASFVISDTPGFDISNISELSQSILDNAKSYLNESSVIILLLENPYAMAFDLDIADIIRKLSIPTIIAVNKMDNDKDLENMPNFYEMGFSDILPISALRNVNIKLLLDKIVTIMPEKISSIDNNVDIKISIVGRPNSGKSTLLNSLVGYNRVITSDIPGTTRDAIDEEFPFDGKRIQIVDTAGLKRKRKIKGNIEFYSLTRTIRSIKNSNLVIHMVDALMGLTETDKKISDEIIKARKPIIIAINKWDALEKDKNTFEEYKEKIIFKFYRAGDFPIISISAKDKVRIYKLIKIALELNEKAKRRIDTSKLNKIIEDIQKRGMLPRLGETLKIYYATQVETVPPQFKFFVNNPDLFKKDEVRYLQKILQNRLDLKGIPIIIDIVGRTRTKWN